VQGESQPVSFNQMTGPSMLTVFADGNCTWRATSSQPWLRLVAGASGMGSGAIGYQVDENPLEKERSAVITVRGNSTESKATINQARYYGGERDRSDAGGY